MPLKNIGDEPNKDLLIAFLNEVFRGRKHIVDLAYNKNEQPIFEKLFSIAEYTNFTKEEKTMYDNSLKYKWDNKDVLDYAVKEAEYKNSLVIAREMKKDGLPLAQIVKFTKLSIEEIEKL